MKSYYETGQEQAVQDAVKLLDQPESFDPWELFPCLYGSYSAEFDVCMIDVLTEIMEETVIRRDLAAEMMREILCTSDFCDYGTSPRSCFATSDFKKVLPLLIERWKSYYAAEWGTNYCRTQAQ